MYDISDFTILKITFILPHSCKRNASRAVTTMIGSYRIHGNKQFFR